MRPTTAISPVGKQQIYYSLFFHYKPISILQNHKSSFLRNATFRPFGFADLLYVIKAILLQSFWNKKCFLSLDELKLADKKRLALDWVFPA